MADCHQRALAYLRVGVGRFLELVGWCSLWPWGIRMSQLFAIRTNLKPKTSLRINRAPAGKKKLVVIFRLPNPRSNPDAENGGWMRSKERHNRNSSRIKISGLEIWELLQTDWTKKNAPIFCCFGPNPRPYMLIC